MRLASCFYLGFLLAMSANATRYAPPTLTDLVERSEHIGLAVITKSEAYDIVDSHGEFPCGVVYEATWVDSISEDVGTFRFASEQTLEIRGLYLLYLSHHPSREKNLSTNSISEARLRRIEGRRSQCTKMDGLPRTVFGAAKFTNDEWTADTHKTETWIESPGLRRSGVDELVVFPVEININGRVMSREKLIEDHSDHGKHQWLRAAEYWPMVFKAVDWAQYCQQLLLHAETKFKGAQNKSRFCERKRQWKAPGV